MELCVLTASSPPCWCCRREDGPALGYVRPMARLDPQERADLPDRAFAYVDSHGRRRLPIHDPPHIRNALARFSQVTFDDEPARDRARLRLLNAAKAARSSPSGSSPASCNQRELSASTKGAPSRCPRDSSRC